MSRSMLAKVLEAFFQHRFLYVLPLLALMCFGTYRAFSASGQYTSHAVVFVDRDSFVADRTGIGGEGAQGFRSVAAFASQELNGLLQTDVFMESVLEDAGVELAPDPIFRSYQIDSARASIGSSAASENLMTIWVTTGNPLASERLASATINRFLEFKISLDIADSEAAEAFFADLADDYEAELAEARLALDTFLEQIPATSLDQLSAAQQRELDRLTEAERSAAGKYTSTLDDLDASRLAALQAETDVRQSISVVDPPQVASQPDSNLFDEMLTVAMFTLVGIALTVVGPTAAALVDRSFRFAEDLTRVTDANVIAVVPRFTKRDLKLGDWPTLEPATTPDAEGEESSEAADTVRSDQRRDSETPDRTPAVQPLRSARPRSRWSRVGDAEALTDAAVVDESTSSGERDDDEDTGWQRRARA